MQNGQGRTDTTLKLPSPYNIKNPTDQGVFDGTNTVKGVDADLYWSPSKEFSMFAYFSYLDAKQGTVSTGAKAANLTGVGKVNGSVWGKHTWYKVGSFDTFYAGGGMTYRSEVESSWSQGSATMPKIGAQTTLDLVFGVTKKFGKKNVLQFQVNGANVTDKLLMNPNSAVLGNGREFTFTTSLKF